MASSFIISAPITWCWRPACEKLHKLCVRTFHPGRKLIQGLAKAGLQLWVCKTVYSCIVIYLSIIVFFHTEPLKTYFCSPRPHTLALFPACPFPTPYEFPWTSVLCVFRWKWGSVGSHCVSKLGVHRNFQAGREMAQGRPEGDSLHLRKAGQITHTLGHHSGSWNRRQLWLREAEAPLASEAVNPLHCQNLLVLPRSFLPLFSQSLVLSSPLPATPNCSGFLVYLDLRPLLSPHKVEI